MASLHKVPKPDPVVDLIAQAQEPASIIKDWRYGVLNILLPIIALAILPALIQTIYQIFIYKGIGWQGPVVYIAFYAVLVFVALRRSLGSTARGWFLVALTFLTGVVAMLRGGLAGDGRIYLVIVPILAVTLINTRTGLVAALVSLVTYTAFGILANYGFLHDWLICFDNPLDGEYWVYSGLTMGVIVIACVFLVTRFSKFQVQTLESSKRISLELASAYRQLEVANLELEQKVEQRTSELSKANNRLEFLATHDNLTGLPNRLLLYDRLDQAVKKGQRNKTGFALFFIDLDDFKRVNDSFGHAVGDMVLEAVGDALSKCMRLSDTVARLAGDEFALILHDLETPVFIDTIMEKVVAALGKPIQVMDSTISITASIGVSVYPDHGSDPDSLLRKADQAMYIAKNEGKNRYSLSK